MIYIKVVPLPAVQKENNDDGTVEKKIILE